MKKSTIKNTRPNKIGTIHTSIPIVINNQRITARTIIDSGCSRSFLPLSLIEGVLDKNIIQSLDFSVECKIANNTIILLAPIYVDELVIEDFTIKNVKLHVYDGKLEYMLLGVDVFRFFINVISMDFRKWDIYLDDETILYGYLQSSDITDSNILNVSTDELATREMSSLIESTFNENDLQYLRSLQKLRISEERFKQLKSILIYSKFNTLFPGWKEKPVQYSDIESMISKKRTCKSKNDFKAKYSK